MSKPKLDELWKNFPDHREYPTMKDLYTMLGGQAELNINESGFGPNGNTCASRLSVAFNKSGARIYSEAGIKTLGTHGGARIIYKISSFRVFLHKLLGKPVADKTPPYNDAFMGKKGIIAFSINFANATGHIALWNGKEFREPAHDSYENYVSGRAHTSLGEFWELP